MADPWRFLAGVGTGIFVGLLVWMVVAARANACHRRRLLRGLTARLEKFAALLTDLHAESVEPDKVRWKRIHYEIWCVGHILEEAGVRGYPRRRQPGLRSLGGAIWLP